MEINPAYKQFAPQNIAVNIAKPQENNKKTPTPDKNNNNALIASGAILSVALSAYWIYKNKSVSSTKKIKYTTYIPDKLSICEKWETEQYLKKLDFRTKELSEFINNPQDEFNKFKTLLAIHKKPPENFKANIPDFLVFSHNNENKTSDIAKILSHQTDSGLVETKYTKGYASEFLDTLKNIYAESNKRAKTDSTATFLHFKNIDEFLNDISSPQNTKFKETFDNLFKKNRENSVIYISEKVPKEIISSSINLEFNDKLGTGAFSKLLETVKSKLEINLASPKVIEIKNLLSSYTNFKMQDYTIIMELLNKTETPNVINITGKNKDNIREITKIVEEKFGFNAEKIDFTGSLKDTVQTLLNKNKSAKEFFDRTGKKTLLEFENFENVSGSLKNDAFYDEFLNSAKNLFDNEHLVLKINSTNPNNDAEKLFNLKKSWVIKSSDESANYYEVMNLLREKADLNDFSHMDKDWFITHFANHVEIEKLTGSKSSLITNGIMLYGSKEGNEISARSMKNTLDVNWKTITFNESNPIATIGQIEDISKEAEEIFKTTKRRTILEINDLDEMLTQKEKIKDVITIGRFKAMVEHISNDFHTTLLLKTDRPLKDFEPASIAAHRFSLKIKTT